MAKRMEDVALSFHDSLIWAAKTEEKDHALARADFHLERLKVYNHLAVKLKLSSFAQYEYLAKELNALEQIVNAFTANWIPAFAGMTPVLDSWSVMPAHLKRSFTKSDGTVIVFGTRYADAI